MIYLDHAASTPVREISQSVYLQSLASDFANASSAHSLGRQLAKRIEGVRETLLQVLSAKDFRVVFTGSATEANNLVILGSDWKPGQRIWVSHADHPSLVGPVEQLRQKAVEIKEIPLHRGWVDCKKLGAELGPEDHMIVFSHVNNSSGHVQDVAGFSRQARDQWPQLKIHLDAVQSFGKFVIDLGSDGLTSTTLSGHKMGGPKGIAALVMRNNLAVNPQQWGGNHEYGLRPATLNAPAIFSWLAAISEAEAQREESFCRVSGLRQVWMNSFENEDGVEFPFTSDKQDALMMSPYIVLMRLSGIPSDILMRHLEEQQIYVSSSSACSSKVRGPSRVYSALGLPESLHHELLRISFSPSTAESDVLRAAEVLKETYRSLRRLYI